MINYTSKTDSHLRPEALANRPAAARPTPPRSTESDRLSAAGQEALSTALLDQPEIRSEAVRRGQELMVDANYPPKEIIRQLSELLIASADLAEQA